MRIARIRSGGLHSWALIDPDQGSARLLAGGVAEWGRDIASGRADPPLTGESLAREAYELTAPVEPGARLFGVGMNYQAHLTQLGWPEPPAHPLAFLMPETAIIGPGDEIRYPPTTAALDFEIELVAVVAEPLGDRTCASQALLGYTIGVDTSARDAGAPLKLLDVFGQKALDSATPVGPWVSPLHMCGGEMQPALDMELKVNGELRQADNTANMIFSIEEVLNYVDIRVQLRPGDLVFTGTTCGVGKEDGRYLKEGDLLNAKIAGIGDLTNRVGRMPDVPPARRKGRIGLPE